MIVLLRSDKTSLSFTWTAPVTAATFTFTGFAVAGYNNAPPSNAWYNLNAVSVTVGGTAPAPPSLPCLAGCNNQTLNLEITHPLEAYANNQNGQSTPDSYHVPGVTPVKHDPVVLKALPNGAGGANVKVVVRGTNGATGDSFLHPMGPSHYITTIWVKDMSGNVVYLKQFDRTSPQIPPIMEFTVPAGTTTLIPYEYCNLHGLWKALLAPSWCMVLS